MIRITQQRIKCIGCNACVEAANYRWRMSRRDVKCTLIGSKEKKGFYTMLVGNDEYADTIMASKNCPVNIIKIELIK